MTSSLNQQEHGGLEKADNAPKKKRIVYEHKKRKNKKFEQPKTPEAEPVVEPVNEEPEVIESWEDGVKDSWDDPSSEDADDDAVESKVDDWETSSLASDTEELKKKMESLKVGSKASKAATSVQKPVKSSDKGTKDTSASDDLRSPICCILGHVDAGKTSLLDKIRATNVAGGEAGGITQQIGATYMPIHAIEEKTKRILETDKSLVYKIPGLLVIDTPGHESFTNLRSRGSSLCNIAVLVVDIIKGFEPQTIESINLLKQRRTPFVVALNKVDRLYGWKASEGYPIEQSLEKQNKNVWNQYLQCIDRAKLAFAEQSLNAELFYENKKLGRYISLVPTSATTGEGIPDLLHLLIRLTQERMTDNLRYLTAVECTVLEVNIVEGHGVTIDVILSNGVLNEGDRICLCGMNGPITTNIRALLTPQPLREIRSKSQFVHLKQVKAALGVKISAPELDKAVAGSRLVVIKAGDDEDAIRDEIQADLDEMLDRIDRTGRGVFVQASTLGSLEALLEFLKTQKIPVSGINIGPVHKKDVIRASVMLEQAKEYACILAFDVPIQSDAERLAEESGVKIFSEGVIYKLTESFQKYLADIVEQRRKDQAPQAVFPCVLKIVPGCIFNKRQPIIIGVDVVEGTLHVGTPLCVVDEENQVVSLGKVTGIEQSHKAKETIKKGDPSAAIKIECASYDTPKMFGRHFTEKDTIYSLVSRPSIEILKEMFRDDLSRDDWALVIKLKKVLKIE